MKVPALTISAATSAGRPMPLRSIQMPITMPPSPPPMYSAEKASDGMLRVQPKSCAIGFSRTDIRNMLPVPMSISPRDANSTRNR